MNRNTRRSKKAHVEQAIEECRERLSDMRAGQERHCEGKKSASEPNRRRGLRKFTEAHVAFLNAAYSAGEYLRQSISRERLTDVEALLKEANIQFHRELRNTVDHTERVEYMVTFEFQQMIALKTPDTLPHPDLRVAMSMGLVAVESEPGRVGKGHLSYNRNTLSGDDVKRLDAAMIKLGVKENPSVLYMAERCYERLVSFATSASHHELFREN